MDRAALGALAAATGAWVLLSSAVAYHVLHWGPACSTIRDDEFRPLGRGAAAVCGGEFPFTPVFLTFVGVAFVALAALILGGGGTRRQAWRLCAGVATLPVVAFVVLRGISLLP